MQQVLMQLPTSRLNLLADSSRSLVAKLLPPLRRQPAQALVLAIGSAGLALALRLHGLDFVGDVAQRAAGRTAGVSLETCLGCMALSSFGVVLLCGGVCFLVARHLDQRISDSDDVLAVVHARQAALRRFSEGVLDELHHNSSAVGLDRERLAQFREWYNEQLEMQDIVLSTITKPSLDPQARMQRLIDQLNQGSVSNSGSDAHDVSQGWDSKASSGPFSKVPASPQGSQGAAAGRAGGEVWRSRNWRVMGDAMTDRRSLAKDRAQLERLLHLRSPSERPGVDEGHHQLFIAHLLELRRLMERSLGLNIAASFSTSSSSGSAGSSGGVDYGAGPQGAGGQESQDGGVENGGSASTGDNRG
ncbi:hypothetical protein N2152v2_003067 [Parachlorella kessleri]